MAKFVAGLLLLVLALWACKMAVGAALWMAKVAAVGLLVVGAVQVGRFALARRR